MATRVRALDFAGTRPNRYSYDNQIEGICRALIDALYKVPNKNAETLAKATYEALRKAATKVGQNPDMEVGISAPGSGYYPGRSGDANAYWVTWEAGPHDWGIAASMAISSTFGLCEPYYGFDLTFYTTEEYK
jgi:hypothetical protein